MHPIEGTQGEQAGGGLGGPDTIPVKDPAATARDTPWHGTPFHPPLPTP